MNFRLQEQLIDELWAAAKSNTITGYAILNAIADGEHTVNEVLSYVKEQALDSFKTMSEAIGEPLTNKILNTDL